MGQIPTFPQPPLPALPPMAELVLELRDFRFRHQNNTRRVSARAKLVIKVTAGPEETESATPGQEACPAPPAWQFVAPIGPIEADELRWYLEKYAIWPSHYFADRARKVEQNIVEWGQLLYQAAFPTEECANLLQAWANGPATGMRCFSVLVDQNLGSGAPADEVLLIQEMANMLLGLPWELLHDGRQFLFQGDTPCKVRRRLSINQAQVLPVFAAPIRILLITARPEDDSCGYIDHRASSLPLMEAMEGMPGLVEIHMLNPPTVGALAVELARAQEANAAYQVVHFDGHGVFHREAKMGCLCFELETDEMKLTGRGLDLVYASQFAELLKKHQIPLVFLEACQSAQAEGASESVASELLKGGIASVVAMSHSVLVETARRFVARFYRALAGGERVGDAMLAGQRALKLDAARGQVFGEGDFRLQDWFVPVLFQAQGDPQLFTQQPAAQSVVDFKTALRKRMGNLPDEPATGFIGRSRELLVLQRLLWQGEMARYAVVLGQGGEGKTALATEFARWMVRSGQVAQVAFVSVEMHSHVAAVLDALGRQLVDEKYSVAMFAEREQAILTIEQALARHSTLVVLDNMESILLPPYVEVAAALSEDLAHELDKILALCKRLNRVGATRLIFTSRETLPAPFNVTRHLQRLAQHDYYDAIRLVERALAMGKHGKQPEFSVPIEEIEQLVQAVNCHARTLALLAPSLRERGVQRTRLSLVELMLEMEEKFPTNREKSLFASVELSLRRLSRINQERVRVLAVFYGGVHLQALGLMMEWESSDVESLAQELIDTGLATKNPYYHITLNPALCPYLRTCMPEHEYQELEGRWMVEMGRYVGFLHQQTTQDAELSASLLYIDMPNVFAFLEKIQLSGDTTTTANLAVALHRMLQFTGKPQLISHVGKIRDQAINALGASWDHTQFEAERTRIEQQLEQGEIQTTLAAAQALYERTQALGEHAHPDAPYDMAIAGVVLAKVLKAGGNVEPALPLLKEAKNRFDVIAKTNPNAIHMASVCMTEQGDCLMLLRRLEEAEAAYKAGIESAEKAGDKRGVAVGITQMGTVRMLQQKYQVALKAFADAVARFESLGDIGALAMCWHQTGLVYAQQGQLSAAEDAYMHALRFDVQLGNLVGQASALTQLGSILNDEIGRGEQAITFLRQALAIITKIGDVATEGLIRTNLALGLTKSGRLSEARAEIMQAFKCGAQLGDVAEPWQSWEILSEIETQAGNDAAANQARQKAISSFLDFRRASGENHHGPGRLGTEIAEYIRTGNTAGATVRLHQVANEPTAAYLRPFIKVLHAIVAGSRDRRLADTPGLRYTMAAEILFLLEKSVKFRGSK